MLAAGGIGSGEQIAAALALGAQGVWAGSLWLTVEEAGKARTRGKALQVLVDKVFEGGPVEHVCVTHGLAPELEQVLDLIGSRYPRDQVRTGIIGPVIGAHGGPRVMGVTWVEGSKA